MALYKHSEFIAKSSHEAFDQVHEPGEDAPVAGIYRCIGCDREIGIAHGHTMPPQNHHTHTAAQGDILWRLVVCTQKPKS